MGIGADYTDFEEMIHVLELVSKVNRKYTLPAIKAKTGVTIVNAGADYGMVQLKQDLDVSKAMLYGIPGLADGLKTKYPGSFTEEEDSDLRLEVDVLHQVDPIDGSGDLKLSNKSGNLVPPTTLDSKLKRNSDGQFYPVAGLIFDIVNEIGLISDGENIGLYKVNEDGIIKDVKFEQTQPYWTKGDKIRINRRVSYPQLTYDGAFMDYLRANDLDIEVVPAGGAGIFAMQVFRNYIQPTSDNGKAFANLKPLDIGFNAQPDWKTWDTNATDVIAEALRMPKRTNIFGERLEANAANPTLKDMHHTKGYVLSTSYDLRETLTQYAFNFSMRNTNCPLLKKDYEYIKEIVSLVSKPE